MRKKIIGLAVATFLIAVGLLATTAIVAAQGEDNPNKNHIFVFEATFLSASPPVPILELEIRTMAIREWNLFREGEGPDGDVIGTRTGVLTKTKPKDTQGFWEDSALEFLDVDTLHITRLFPYEIRAITVGTGAFQGAQGQCSTTALGPAHILITCDLGIFAPEIPE